jgi:hypothetical protein
MKVIAEINGCRGIINVDEEVVRRGFFYMPIRQPIDMLINQKDIVKNDFGVTAVKLIKTKDGIFKNIT